MWEPDRKVTLVQLERETQCLLSLPPQGRAFVRLNVWDLASVGQNVSSQHCSLVSVVWVCFWHLLLYCAYGNESLTVKPCASEMATVTETVLTKVWSWLHQWKMPPRLPGIRTMIGIQNNQPDASNRRTQSYKHTQHSRIQQEAFSAPEVALWTGYNILPPKRWKFRELEIVQEASKKESHCSSVTRVVENDLAEMERTHIFMLLSTFNDLVCTHQNACECTQAHARSRHN